MKIRKATDTSDMRGKTTKDRVCEECKEIKTEGCYLTLGYFFGFLCNACLNRLAFLIRQEGIWYEPNIDQPDSTKDLFCACGAVGAHLRNSNECDGTVVDNLWPSNIGEPDTPESSDIVKQFGLNYLTKASDAPTQPTDEIRDILGDKVTQEVYDYLIDRVIALERALQEAADTKIRIATSYLTLKGIFEESAEGLKKLEQRMLGEKL